MLVPTLGAGATFGLPAGLAAGLRHDTYAGLAHVTTLSARVRLSPRWALGLDGGFGFFVSDELFGVELSQSPFANGFTVEPLALHTRGRVGLAAGLTVRLTNPALRSAKIALSVDTGPLFLRVEALIPLERDTRVLGYLPTVAVGKVWGL